MKLLVGYTADERGAEAIELASALVAGTEEAELILAIVLPQAAPFNAVYPGSDHGYSTMLSAQVDQWAQQAMTLVPSGIKATVVAQSVSSVAEGLIGLAQQYSSHGIVLGGRKRHRAGFFMPGAIANALLHSSPVSVFMSSPTAMDNLRNANGKLSRLTAFVGDRPGAKDVIELAASLATAHQLPLRVVSLVLPLDVQDPEFNLDGHVNETSDYLRKLTESMDLDASVEVVVGRNLDEATAQLSWQDGDLALLGSARLAAKARLFIGPKAQRILGGLSVPLGVIPKPESSN